MRITERECVVSLKKICEYAVDIVVPHVMKLHAAVKVGLSNGQPMNARIASGRVLLLDALHERCKSE